MEAGERLRVVADAIGLVLDPEPVALPSDSNDVWRVGDRVLRVCWRGDRGRLAREAVLLAHLPASVPHAPLVDSGAVGVLGWMLTRWLPGRPAPARADLRRLGAVLAALHAWDPPPVVRSALAPPDVGTDSDRLVGAQLNALPVDRALQLIEPATGLVNVAPHLVRRLGERLEELRPLDPFARPDEHVVVHGDAHGDNVLWAGGELVALLDLEWARLGPPDLELQPLITSGPDVVRSVVAGAPALAAHPRFIERMWLYDLAFTLRDLFVKHPNPPADDLPPWHPNRRLAEIVAAPTYLASLFGLPAA